MYTVWLLKSVDNRHFSQTDNSVYQLKSYMKGNLEMSVKIERKLYTQKFYFWNLS